MESVTVVPPLSRVDIEKMAFLVRDAIQCRDRPYFPVVSFLESIPELYDPGFDYEYVEDSELPGVYAKYNPFENKIYIQSSVYDAACKGNGRARFTIAHELGHYFLHKQVASYCRVTTSADNVPGYRDAEWQANTFASYFLMPTHIICGKTAKEVANICGTSLQASEIALNRKKAKPYRA